MLGLILGLLSCVHGTAQFVVERSPWLDGEAVTEEPVHQTWAVADQSTAQLIQAELTVEGLNPRKPVRLRVDEDTTLKLAPYRRYSRLCVEPDFMLYADYIYADPEIQADTLLLEPLAIGLETALLAIEFMPGTEDLYFTSVPAGGVACLHRGQPNRICDHRTRRSSNDGTAPHQPEPGASGV